MSKEAQHDVPELPDGPIDWFTIPTDGVTAADEFWSLTRSAAILVAEISPFKEVKIW